MTAGAIDRLIADERLPQAYAETVDTWWRPLADRIAEWHAAARSPLIVGINGAQGSGKSTLCRFLELLLAVRGLSTVTLSLDDLYLPRSDRERLAQEVHPLLRTRGVPGTHDVALGVSILDALRAGRDIAMPRFSKALDDRLPSPDWTRHHGRVDVVLFEGWCVGTRPQDARDLADPQNALEADEDADGCWRRHVNDALATAYTALFAPLDRLVMLRPPSFEAVARNRLLQEHKLRAVAPDAPGVMDDSGVKRFISHYERLTRHNFATLPSHADIVLDLDIDQNVVRASGLTCDHDPG
ncbi:kinase [Sphingomonas sp. Y38-1Y]|uniref:kinase n=1 Tax=Sphingomonas sp. Y38-1Y TaxID=3078265 RepID=UPI0028EBF7ED|nr:kinase [Sphingomonas sp. Y38-1Y]